MRKLEETAGANPKAIMLLVHPVDVQRVLSTAEKAGQPLVEMSRNVWRNNTLQVFAVENATKGVFGVVPLS